MAIVGAGAGSPPSLIGSPAKKDEFAPTRVSLLINYDDIVRDFSNFSQIPGTSQAVRVDLEVRH
jgi:hypothetical protein